MRPTATDHGLACRARRLPRPGWAGLLVLALLASAACTGAQTLISARHTHCAPKKLVIRELVIQADREDWIAICGERTFACSTREQGRRLVNACRERKPVASDSGVAALADAGVSSDASQRSDASAMPDAL
jgi:hypothetical protein